MCLSPLPLPHPRPRFRVFFLGLRFPSPFAVMWPRAAFPVCVPSGSSHPGSSAAGGVSRGVGRPGSRAFRMRRQTPCSPRLSPDARVLWAPPAPPQTRTAPPAPPCRRLSFPLCTSNRAFSAKPSSGVRISSPRSYPPSCPPLEILGSALEFPFDSVCRLQPSRESLHLFIYFLQQTNVSVRPSSWVRYRPVFLWPFVWFLFVRFTRV